MRIILLLLLAGCVSPTTQAIRTFEAAKSAQPIDFKVIENAYVAREQAREEKRQQIVRLVEQARNDL